MSTLRFLRNKLVEVEPLPDGNVAVSWRLTDDLLKAEVNMTFQPPDLEIIEAEARLDRYSRPEWASAPELIKKVLGVRVGPGLRKIVPGLIGGDNGCPVLVFAVLEASNAVILHFTRPGIQMGEGIQDQDEEKRMERLRDMVRNNPRLVRSCISFQDDSPIMQGFDL